MGPVFRQPMQVTTWLCLFIHYSNNDASQFDVSGYTRCQQHTGNSEINFCETFKQFNQFF